LLLVAVFSAVGLPVAALIAITVASGATLVLRVAAVLRRER
jgi:hypothetical protein